MAADAQDVEKVAKDPEKPAETAPAPDKKIETAKASGNCSFLLALLYGGFVAACDGYVNSNTKMRFGTYGGMMTGNTVSLGRSVADEKWEDVALFSTIIFNFFFGALIAWGLSHYKKKGSFRYLVLLVGLGFVVIEILVEVIDSKKQKKWVSTLSAFLMGMIDVIGFKGSLGQHITFMTGNLQKLAGTTYDILALSSNLNDDDSKPNTTKKQQKALAKFRETLITVGCIWASYVAGAIAGACMTKVGDDGQWTLLLPAGVLTVLIFLNEGPTKSMAPKKDPPLFRLFNIEGQKGISLANLRDLYEKMGMTLSSAEEKRFKAADSNDDGFLDGDEFRAWMVA
jgi:uncharacterized membrane protein YoaK (UPF0700 family)